MFNLLSEDQAYENLEKRVHELEIENDALNLKVSKLMQELSLRPEQLTKYLNDPVNFTEKNWQEIQDLKKQYSEKLLTDLLNISKRRKSTTRKRSDAPQPHWVMMR